LAPSDDNARQIIDWLAGRPPTDSPILLVSLSKGGSDVKRALEFPDAARAFANVAVWFNLSGILNGTPLVTWLFPDLCAVVGRGGFCGAGVATST